jgi:hypothetical protein
VAEDVPNADGKKFKLSPETSRILRKLVTIHEEQLKQEQESQPEIRNDDLDTKSEGDRD